MKQQQITIGNHLDCKSKEGIIIGLIDSIMTISSVLKSHGIDLHDQDNKHISEAMKDLKSDNDVSWLLTGKSADEWKENQKSINLAVQNLKVKL